MTSSLSTEVVLFDMDGTLLDAALLLREFGQHGPTDMTLTQP